MQDCGTMQNDSMTQSLFYIWREMWYNSCGEPKRDQRGKLADIGWLIIRNHWGGQCAYCANIGELTRDHVVPVIRGGQTTVDNVVPACRSCNSSKGTTDVEIWMNQRGLDYQRFSSHFKH